MRHWISTLSLGHEYARRTTGRMKNEGGLKETSAFQTLDLMVEVSLLRCGFWVFFFLANYIGLVQRKPGSNFAPLEIDRWFSTIKKRIEYVALQRCIVCRVAEFEARRKRNNRSERGHVSRFRITFSRDASLSIKGQSRFEGAGVSGIEQDLFAQPV